MQKVKTIFIGSGEFAVPILQGLLSLSKVEDPLTIDLVCVITQPDKPKGRKQELEPCPVASYAKVNDLELLQPEKLSIKAGEIVGKYSPELIIVADYGQMIPKILLEAPKYKCLNVHGSLLPDLRGAVPIPIAILKGYKETGVSIPVMTPGLDDGPVIAEEQVEILDDDNTSTLKARMAQVGSILLMKTLPKWIRNEIQGRKQDSSKATFTQMDDISKDKAKFSSSDDVIKVDRMARAMFPWPIAWTEIKFNNKILRLKIFSAEISEEIVPAGEILSINKELYLGLRDGCLKLNKIQLEGKAIGKALEYQYLHNARMLV